MKLPPGETAAMFDEVFDSIVGEAVETRDFGPVATALNRYGMFLLLLGWDEPVSGLQVFTAGGVRRD